VKSDKELIAFHLHGVIILREENTILFPQFVCYSSVRVIRGSYLKNKVSQLYLERPNSMYKGAYKFIVEEYAVIMCNGWNWPLRVLLSLSNEIYVTFMIKLG
jgi:hypothetical protein